MAWRAIIDGVKDRRRIRRSSPDAPQGFVPVVTVFAALVAAIVIAGIGFIGSRGSSSTSSPDRSAKASQRTLDRDGATTVAAPTTGLIRGSVATALFVTTTTPITTTTSTTTTTLAGPALSSTEAQLVFGPGDTSVTFTVNSASPDGIDFLVTGVPPGMRVTPNNGTVSQGSPVSVALSIVDATKAQSGQLVLVGSDGSRASIQVIVEGGAFAVAAVATAPNPPVCGRPSQLVALVRGGPAVIVTAVVNSANGTRNVVLNQTSPGAWATALPGLPAGSSVSGTVTAIASGGKTAGRGFSTIVANGPGCGG